MTTEYITLRGCRTHNLKNIDISLPRNQLVVITGLSGSGKSSLAFDTIYAEGQRRYVESLSSYARQFLSMMDKPDLDHIEGLSPAISIDQKSVSHNPRSTVGTVTEIHDYLRLLFARVGTAHCPNHHIPLDAQTVRQMVNKILALPKDTKVMLLAPVIRERKGEHHTLFEGLLAQGFLRARINGEMFMLEEPPTIDPKKKHTIEVVIDRLKIRDDLTERLSASLDTALRMGKDVVRLVSMDDDSIDLSFSAKHACPYCSYALAELAPRLFSFNSPQGACPKCDGLGKIAFFDPEKIVLDDSLSLAEGAIPFWGKQYTYYYATLQMVAKHYQFDLEIPFKSLSEQHKKIVLFGSGKEKIKMLHGRFSDTRPFEGVVPNYERRYLETESRQVRDELGQFRVVDTCKACSGARLNESARHVFVADRPLSELTDLSISDAFDWFNNLKLKGAAQQIAEKIVQEICNRLSFLVNVGLGYLNLARSADTLSGGEAQRIRLASQIGAGLVGVMYILDEPSIGLHQRDNHKLLQTLIRLRDIGNTVIVVEHDEETIRNGDFIVDVGPLAGEHGGEIIFAGKPEQLLQQKHSITGQFLSNKRTIFMPEKRRTAQHHLEIIRAQGNNLQNIFVSIPISVITCITGVSGSGKSTLINHTLYPKAANELNRASHACAPVERIDGLEYLDKVINIDQSPIGRTPRSNPATYVGIFTTVRELFAGTKEARIRGFNMGRFSFNVRGGRCEACQGDGLLRVEMHFLPDVYVLCDECQGKRYNEQTLAVQYNGKNIAEVLDMTVEEALQFFEAIPSLHRKLQTLQDVGLGYIRLGQSATTLSGGEAQRIKLAKELSKRDTSKTLYILDEPTTGLHFYDVDLLLQVLMRLCDKGNTIVIIEHNLDVIKACDWIIDLGPEGGCGGGQVIGCGTPEDFCKQYNTHTAQYLRPLLT